MSRRTKSALAVQFVQAGAVCVAAMWIGASAHADWNNSGGNAGRNGLIGEIGPDVPSELWPAGTPVPGAIIAYQPIIEGSRLFMVRQNSFIPNNVPNDSPIVAKDLHTGATLWTVNLPYVNGQWTTWVGGARNGRVYASRSGNGGSSTGKLNCLDAATGAMLWPGGSQAIINAGSYDGMSFAANGDPIVAGHTMIWRINQNDGTTMWAAPRLCSVSGNCGPAVSPVSGAVYVADAAVGGHVIKRFDIDTGAFMYQSPVMIGFTLQNSPMVGPDGTVYVARVQNNINTDFFYAWTDTVSSLELKWSVPARWTTSSEFAVGPDGSVYMIAPGNVISRRNPQTGAEMNASAPILLDSAGGNFTPRMAIDDDGRLFFSNGQFANGRFYSFNADLTERWNLPVPNINIGAPAIGENGVLVVCGIGSNVKAYDTEDPLPAPCVEDVAPEGPPSGDGVVNIIDLLAVISHWGACPPPKAYCPDCAPFGGDGQVDILDLLAVIGAWGECP
ncbi:MAG: PQQ-binding-like beta-propeller repeat protein [Phycisphaerales bacterium]|nr:PQQ-binding-like beta-propeller repeat protein [Phycisphaerales bacterium]MCI0674367.1 PQQ-binding-like beta-propeller repeat protein [Phycisphaerales bacterium]